MVARECVAKNPSLSNSSCTESFHIHTTLVRIMRDAVRNAGVREVHHHVVVLGDDGRSPPGKS